MPRLPLTLTMSCLVALTVPLSSTAWCTTFFVANNGEDGTTCAGSGDTGCGSKTNPCRSITCALSHAGAKDTIIVGPGLYGDLDADGTIGEQGEEAPAPGCDCMLAFNKPVTLISSAGAAGTIIDARTVGVKANVAMSTGNAGGGAFGKPGKGFTVTGTGLLKDDVFNGTGIAIDSNNVTIEGNQVIFTGVRHGPTPTGTFSSGTGIATPLAGFGVVHIQRNQVIGWGTGIFAGGANATVQGNQVSRSATGIHAAGTTIVSGNVAVDNVGTGFLLFETPVVVGNASIGNGLGFLARSFNGTLEKNNLFASRFCGIANEGPGGVVVATNNFWGASTGPGSDQPHGVCDFNGATTTVEPFSAKPFKVKAPIKP